MNIAKRFMKFQMATPAQGQEVINCTLSVFYVSVCASQMVVNNKTVQSAACLAGEFVELKSFVTKPIKSIANCGGQVSGAYCRLVGVFGSSSRQKHSSISFIRGSLGILFSFLRTWRAPQTVGLGLPTRFAHFLAFRQATHRATA